MKDGITVEGLSLDRYNELIEKEKRLEEMEEQIVNINKGDTVALRHYPTRINNMSFHSVNNAFELINKAYKRDIDGRNDYVDQLQEKISQLEEVIEYKERYIHSLKLLDYIGFRRFREKEGWKKFEEKYL